MVIFQRPIKLGTSVPIRSTGPMDLMLYGNFYQLMRNQLLADRMVAEQELGVTDAKLVVVAPEGNSSYREGSVSSVLSERCRGARTVEEVMQAALKNPDRTFATRLTFPASRIGRAGVWRVCTRLVGVYAGAVRDVSGRNMDKRSAMEMVNEHWGSRLLDGGNTSFANINASKPVWWININPSKFKSDLHLLLAKEGDGGLIWLRIEGNSFPDVRKVFRVRQD